MTTFESYELFREECPNGYTWNGRVVVIADSPAKAKFTMGHEFTHVLRNSGAQSAGAYRQSTRDLWSELVKHVRDSYGEDYQGVYDEMAGRYGFLLDGVAEDMRRTGRSEEEIEAYKRDYIEEEIVSDWAGEKMFADAAEAQRFVERVRMEGGDSVGICQRMLNYLSAVIDKLKAMVSPEDRQLLAYQNARKIWETLYKAEAARVREEKNRGENTDAVEHLAEQESRRLKAAGWDTEQPKFSIKVASKKDVDEYDKMNGTEFGAFVKFVEGGKKVTGKPPYFHVGNVGTLLRSFGMSGKITIGSKAINEGRHSKGVGHSLGTGNWLEVMKAINEPLAVTKYNDDAKSFRIYTNVNFDDKNICVGVDVKPSGRDSEVTKVVTAFGRDLSRILTSNTEKLLYPTENKLRQIVEQSSSGHNPQIYAQLPVSGGKGSEDISSVQENGGKNAAEPTSVNLNGTEYAVSDIENSVRADVERVISDGGFDAEIVGVKVIGSRMRGEERADSDLDVLVEYKGGAKEDSLFDAIADEALEINGVKVDVNPITRGKSGTIEQFMKRNAGFGKQAETGNGSSVQENGAGNYSAVQKERLERWKELAKDATVDGRSLWDEAANDPAYADIKGDDDAVAQIVAGTLTGPRGEQMFRSMMDEARREADPLAQAEKIDYVWRLRRALSDMRDSMEAGASGSTGQPSGETAGNGGTARDTSHPADKRDFSSNPTPAMRVYDNLSRARRWSGVSGVGSDFTSADAEQTGGLTDSRMEAARQWAERYRPAHEQYVETLEQMLEDATTKTERDAYGRAIADSAAKLAMAERIASGDSEAWHDRYELSASEKREKYGETGAEASGTGALKFSIQSKEERKKRQFGIIEKNNPHNDELGMHTWIRKPEDIKTYDEALDEWGDEDIAPDFTIDDARKAAESGQVVVYSSKPVKAGNFVTPSKMEAESYAGGGRVYNATVRLDDVAWIDAIEGQYAKVEDEQQKFSMNSSNFKEGEEYNENLVSETFDKELQQQIDNPESMRGHIYRLGKPSEKLIATGFPADQAMEMSATHLKEKSEKKHHPFPLKAMKGLVKALRNPLAVFAYGKDGSKAQNAIVEMQYNGDNFLIGVHFNQEKGGKMVASIRGVFPKYNTEWLGWIERGKDEKNHLLGVDKSKVLPLIEEMKRGQRIFQVGEGIHQE